MAQTYRQGVLIGNFNEDKYGIELTNKAPRPDDPKPSSYNTYYKWPTVASSDSRELKKDVAAKNHLPSRLLFGHAGYTGRQGDFERREFLTTNDYFYQNPADVKLGTISANRFTIGTAPEITKPLGQTVLNDSKYRDGMGVGHLKAESNEHMMMTNYQRTLSKNDERRSFIHGKEPIAVAPRLQPHRETIAHAGYRALQSEMVTGPPNQFRQPVGDELTPNHVRFKQSGGNPLSGEGYFVNSAGWSATRNSLGASLASALPQDFNASISASQHASATYGAYIPSAQSGAIGLQPNVKSEAAVRAASMQDLTTRGFTSVLQANSAVAVAKAGQKDAPAVGGDTIINRDPNPHGYQSAVVIGGMAPFRPDGTLNDTSPSRANTGVWAGSFNKVDAGSTGYVSPAHPAGVPSPERTAVSLEHPEYTYGRSESGSLAPTSPKMGTIDPFATRASGVHWEDQQSMTGTASVLEKDLQ